MDKTFSIIKPDATKRNITGSINNVIEKNGLRIIAQKRIKLNNNQAESFYAIHKEKPFFRDLINYMTSEPVIVQVLSFKITGKRIFQMAPLHHHFEKKGWPESTIVIRFWIIAIVLALLGLATLKIR